MDDEAGSPDTAGELLPVFPLGSVLFPGAAVPLHVFEDRYRALVHHLLRVPDPADRLFASVAIREGYEVGERWASLGRTAAGARAAGAGGSGFQQLYRTGVLLQLTDVEAHPDGTFDILAVGRGRVRVDGLEPSGDAAYPTARVHRLVDAPAGEGAEAVPTELLEQARATFTGYRAVLAGLGIELGDGERLPSDPTMLSWTLAARAPLPLPDRQRLLEAATAEERLHLVVDLLRAEVRAANVIPSLPATQVARTGWSPN